MGKGLKAYVPAAFSPRVVVSKSSAYTVTYSDDQINLTASAALTLPAISDMAASKVGNKMFKVYNGHTAANTISPATGNTINGGSSSLSVPAGDTVIIKANQGDTDWELVSPTQEVQNDNIKDDTLEGVKAVMGKFYNAVIDTTSGTTAQNVFGSGGAPCALTITGVVTISKDTNAANITLKNGTNTVSTVAKGTSAGLVTGEDTLANTTVAAAATVTVESSATNGDAHVIIFFEVA